MATTYPMGAAMVVLEAMGALVMEMVDMAIVLEVMVIRQVYT